MADNFTLSPEEAAQIAANVYFTLEGWEATYQFKLMYGNDAKGAPKPVAGMANSKIINKNVVGSGPQSLKKIGLTNGKIVNSFTGSTGSNFSRTKSGFGYVLQFERENKKHIVIATRGTRPEMGYPDLLTDANISAKRNFPGVGPIHAGFYDVYKSILPVLSDIQSIVQAADVVHCVGHSLGGAVANLVALHFAQLGSNIRLYTFGAPRVGFRVALYDAVINGYVGEENIYRVSHNFDPIPMIPVAPYIHALPSIRDNNNIFIGSPVSSISLDNHDTNNYINSVRGKNWNVLRTNKLKQGYLDKQYFTSWRSSDSWLKQYIGNSVNTRMSILQRVLQGLIDTLGIGFTEVATIFDLLVIAIRNGYDSFVVAKSFVIKFITDCANLFGMAVDLSIDVLTKLYRKLMAELAIAAKLALAKAAKVAKSTEFRFVLKTATHGSIGLLLL